MATIGEDLGVIGSVMTLLLYALLIWRVHRLSVRTSADGSRWILIGIGCVLSAWTAFACASVAGVGPQAIVPLPFADFTRVAQIAWFSAIGLTLGLDRTADRGLGGLERRSYRLRVAALTYAVVALLIGGLGTRMWWLQAECGDDNAGHTLTLTERGRAVRTIANPRLVRFASTIERGSIYELGDQVLATSRLREISAATVAMCCGASPSSRWLNASVSRWRRSSGRCSSCRKAGRRPRMTGHDCRRRGKSSSIAGLKR